MPDFLGMERLSSSSLTTWPFDQASGVPEAVYRLFSDCAACVSFDVDDPDPVVSDVVAGGGSLSFSFRMSGSSEPETVSVRPESADGYDVAQACSGMVRFVIDNEHVSDSPTVFGPGPYRLSPGCVERDVPGLRSLSSISVIKS